MKENSKDMILIGKIVTAVGIKGEIKIYSYAQDPSRFEQLDTLYLGKAQEPRDILSVRYKGNTPILLLEGVADRNQAEALRETPVYMDAADLPPLEEGEFYVRDLVGFQVVTEEGLLLGTLRDIYTDTPQRLYVVDPQEGSGEILIPGVDAFILDRNAQTRTITVRLPEGLLDL